MEYCMANAATEQTRASKIKVIENVEQYNEEFLVAASVLVVANFKSIFQYYFIFCSLIFAAFVIHYLVKFAKNRIIVV